MRGTQEYWLEKDPDEIVSHLEGFHNHWVNWTGAPFKQMWLRNYIAYYSPVLHPGSWDTSLIFEGVQGELIRFYTPKARTLIRQLTSIVTKQRLSFQASAARGSDTNTMNQVKLANALADQIVRDQRLDNKVDQLVEGSLVTGVWFTKATWRTDYGDDYITDDRGNKIKNGDVEISTLSPFNVFYNTSLPWDQQPWVECRVRRNRWDLIAEFPKLEEELLAVPSVTEQRGPHNWVDNQLPDDDIVYVYEFYHKPTPSMPEGKMLIYCDEKTIMYGDEDSKNIYGCIPIEANFPELALDSGLGYSRLTDLMGSQEMYDNSLSAIATNQSSFAVQNIAIPRGSNVNVNELAGMNFVEFTPQQGVAGGGKPEALQLSQTAPETFKFADKLEVVMQEMSFLNGAMTGNLPAGVSSGTAIATLSANSIEFITGISKSYSLCMEKTIMHAINAYQRFAAVPRRVTLGRKNGQENITEFTREDIGDVSGVRIETTNILLQSMAGRLEVGEKLMSMPREMWPEYTAILEGRPLSDIYKGDIAEVDLIAQENEVMEGGEVVPAIATDDHARHIQKHAECLADVRVRQNSQAVSVILNHIQEHYSLLKQGDPVLMGIMQTGQVPEGGLQPAPPPGPPPGGNPAMGEAPPMDRPQRSPRDLPEDVPADVAAPSPDPLGRA